MGARSLPDSVLKGNVLSCEQVRDIVAESTGRGARDHYGEPLDPMLRENLEFARRHHIFFGNGDVKCNQCFAYLLNVAGSENLGTI
jgi:hypothetical protein